MKAKRDLTPRVNCFESMNDPDEPGGPLAADHPNSTSPNDAAAARDARLIARAMPKYHRRRKDPRTLEWFYDWEVDGLSTGGRSAAKALRHFFGSPPVDRALATGRHERRRDGGWNQQCEGGIVWG